MDRVFFQNKVSDYLVCIGIFIGGVVIISIAKAIILTCLKKQAERTVTTIDDLLIRIFEKTLIPLLYFGAFYVGINHLTLTPKINKDIHIVGIIVLTFLGIRLLGELISYTLKNYWLKGEKDITKERSLKGILTLVNIVLWAVGIIFLLDNLGFKVSSVVAGLGIGGVAVALAAQTVLKDFFSYFAIVFDKPFEIGDFIAVGDSSGTVEYIGIKTTKLRSLGGEQLTFSNSDLTNSRISNYKRMTQRRVAFKIGVSYKTSPQKLKEIPLIITNIIKNIPDTSARGATSFDRVHFLTYGEFSLVFEIVYYVIGNDYSKYMDIQQEINFAIKEEFEKQGIEFAHPIHTLVYNLN